MPRQLKLATIQMNAEPAPLADRLHSAENLVAGAAADGAQLAVLPEVFNTGYVYADSNYQLAESFDGPTVGWLKATAQKYGIYLVGSLLLREVDDIYNAQILVSPDGNHWRYDKTYPWVWERAYFRGGSGSLVADTPLGRFGLLVCWDAAHAHLWASYAGKVDAMLVSSCPPLVGQATFVFPDGKHVETSELGPAIQRIYQGAENTFGSLLRRQAAWLGVPVAASTTCGKFSSYLPRPQFSLSLFLGGRPDLWKYLPKAAQVRIESGYFNDSYITSANGEIQAQVNGNGDGFATSLVTLADALPQAKGKQPEYGLNPLTYSIDSTMESAFGSYYRIRAKQR